MINKFNLDTVADPENMNMLIEGINKNEQDIEELQTNVEGVSSAIGQNSNKIAQLSNPNLLINGDFQIWQRGTSFINPNVYGIFTADRWNATVETPTGSTMTVSKGTDSNGEVYMHITGNSKTYANLILYQNFTKAEFPNMSEKTVTITYDIDSNKDLVNVIAQFPNGGVNSFTTINIPSGRRKLSVTVKVVDFLNTGCAIQFLRIMTVTDNIDIKLYSIKMELGEIATPLSPRSYGEELALCQRYYEKSYNISPTEDRGEIMYKPYSTSANGMFGGAFKVTKRIIPTIKIYAPGTGTLGSVRDVDGNVDKVCGIYAASKDIIGWIDAGIVVAGNRLAWHYEADAEIY